jgi:hypothetical protein
MCDTVKNLKKLNHEWICSRKKCNCNEINEDTPDLGDRIIQEIWEQEKRHINSKIKK